MTERARTLRNLATVGLLAGIICVTAGCNPFRRSQAEQFCRGPEGYAEATSVPPLKIPPGLDAPDTSNALRIPELDTPAPPPRTKAQGCLDEPPSYVIPQPKEAPEA